MNQYDERVDQIAELVRKYNVKRAGYRMVEKGCVSTIKHDAFPQQGTLLGRDVRVIFHYDLEHHINGKCVRDDMEEPFRTIFHLEDGRFVMATECQFTF